MSQIISATSIKITWLLVALGVTIVTVSAVQAPTQYIGTVTSLPGIITGWKIYDTESERDAAMELERQAEAKPPTPLTDVQKLTIVAEAKDVEIAKLNVERWSREYQLALEKLNKSLGAAQVKGWRLNEKLEYAKEEPAKVPVP